MLGLSMRCVIRGGVLVLLQPYGDDLRMLKNTSQLAIHDPAALLDPFPDFNEVPVAVVEVAAGDALYIPKGWFHVVKARTGSLSVNFWWN